ncbi:hypothetical protein AQUCO_01500377v1 [Aquilegia coerulea]|uniref:KIB1-4 beta-propeller domain-containing protein n=1 Tax=Aquilegia coerulea TaxID=218851 RepID=A0A2G5DTL3_AQUCA|nr:hypothetical protein AQUCO_01500377v1 [Aquilegia coerulea]
MDLLQKETCQHRKKAQFILWNIHTQNQIVLPSWNPNDFDICHHHFLSSPPTDPDCMVLSVGEEFFLFWRQGDKKWTKQYYKIGDNDGVSSEYIDKLITSFNGTIYACTFQRNLVTIKRRHCGTLSIRLLNIVEPQTFPPVFVSEYYIVESCGELYYVLLHYLPISEEINRVEIFKLNSSSQIWIKVDCIGDAVFFLSNYTASMSLSVTNSEIKENQIYFTIPGDNNSLYVYDLEDESLILYLPCPNLQNSQSFLPYWLMHNSRLVERNKDDVKTTYEELKVEKSYNMVAAIQENVESTRPDWTDLPLDVLRLSTTHIIFGTDYRNFRSVCKTWATSVPPNRWPTNKVGSATECPWLMFSNRENITCSFLDPISSFTHCVNMPELMGAKICFSKDGWLLMSKGDHNIFFFNPFNNITIKLPDLPVPFRFSGLSFSSLPTFPDCVVFCVNSSTYNEIDICYLHISAKAWVVRCFNNNVEMILSYSNPVFCDGAFYCLSQQKHLGVFDIKDGRCDWTNLSTPEPEPEPFSSLVRNYLVECNGELLSIHISHLGKGVSVYKLDRSSMKWAPLNSLEDRALFLSEAMSISLKAVDERMKNKIYFPISYNDTNNYVFYSFETRRWYSLFGDYCSEDIYNTREQLHCTWILPILSWKNDIQDS